jgi:hypothetical protein
MTDDKPNDKPRPRVAMGSRGIMLASMDDLWRFAMVIQKSGVADKNLGEKRRGQAPVPPTVEMVCAAVQSGMELGMGPMQSVYAFAAVRGKGLSLLGDAARALIEASPQCEWIKDNQDELAKVTEWTDDVRGWVEAKRKDRPEPVIRSFSVAQAKAAGLWGQPGPWTTYIARMMYYRPLGFIGRDAFGDVLKGLRIMEEMRDIPEENGLPSGATIDPKDLDELTDQIEGKDLAGDPNAERYSGTVTSDRESLDKKVEEELTEEMEG